MYLYLRYFVVHVSYMVESTLLSQKQSSAAKLCDNFLKRVSVGPGVRRKGEMKRGAEERRKVCSWGRISVNAVHGVTRTEAGEHCLLCVRWRPLGKALEIRPLAAGSSLRSLKELMVSRSRVGCDATGGGKEDGGSGTCWNWRVQVVADEGCPLPSEMSVGPLHNPQHLMWCMRVWKEKATVWPSPRPPTRAEMMKNLWGKKGHRPILMANLMAAFKVSQVDTLQCQLP